MEKEKLHYNTITPLLHNVLKTLMKAPEFNSFRLVGGTALSLQLGHRKSVDIDMFTDATYKSIDFKAMDTFLRRHYTYVDTSKIEPVGMGRSYFIGKSQNDSIKLDLFYTDKYIKQVLLIDSIRMATSGEIIAMKLDVILRTGRKKDFWDIHELMDKYSFKEMLDLHKKRYPYTHDAKLIKKKFTDFTEADQDFDPICLRGKIWELIKLDMIDFVSWV